MEEASLIFDYLPLSFRSEEQQKYIEFLWDAFESNYKNKKYQFAFLAYHMLYMCFIYFNLWQIKKNRSGDFQNALIGFAKEEEDILSMSSPFNFSVIREKTVFRFLKLLGCNNQKIGSFSKIVDDRNDIAHSNGNVFYNEQESIDAKIEETLGFVEEIQQCTKPMILECLKEFLSISLDAETREYGEDKEQIREALIHENYFSRKDIEYCLQFDINSISTEPHFAEKKALFDTFLAIYKEQ
jgi:hypothetical protein